MICFDLLSEEDLDETFATDLKEAGLTIANVYEFHRKYGSLSISPANMDPPWSKMDPSGEDDFLFSSDFGLSRYKRAVQNDSVPLYSGEGEYIVAETDRFGLAVRR